jgi:hypothetical protein
MVTEINIDMNPIVGAILAVMTEPYQEFVARRKAEGRITDAEISALHKAIVDRSERLADLVQSELRKLTD